MQPTATADELLAIIVERIVRRFDPLKIVLFGSRARGTARPDSDIDLLVVLPRVADPSQAIVAVLRELRDLPVAKDVIVTTPDEIARRGDLIGTVLRPALRDGKVVYERS